MSLAANDLLLFARVADEGSFSRAAQRLGLPKSTVSRRIAALEEVADTVEAALQEKPEREMSTEEIGAHVMAALRHLDKVAYVRFASVYRHFRDVGEFMDELKGLLTVDKQ